MGRINFLECTLRDGGYITDWKFKDETIKQMIRGLTKARLDFVEVGYLNKIKDYTGDTTQFDSIDRIKDFLPGNKMWTRYIAMADVQQFYPEDITQRDGKSVDGIRVVFYKHQVEEALALIQAVKKNDYDVFVQPMVTIDYTLDEYANLIRKINEIHPYAVSIVDSFGYMMKEDIRCYYRVLDNILEDDITIGFHSHNNMDLAFITAQDIIEYNTGRKLIIDCSLCGMGRGAGNLHTELILNYFNSLYGQTYDVISVLKMISRYIMPIRKEKSWGYNPYYFLTGLKHYHPNYVAYLLEEYPQVTVEQFEQFLDYIPNEMQTKCKKPYVLDMWAAFNKEENR